MGACSKANYGGLWSPPQTQIFGPRRGRMKENLWKLRVANLMVLLGKTPSVKGELSRADCEAGETNAP